MPLRSYLKQVRWGLRQRGLGLPAVESGEREGQSAWGASQQPSCRSTCVPVCKAQPPVGVFTILHSIATHPPRPSPKQGLSLKDERLQVVRSLEVPQGWDSSKNGVSLVALQRYTVAQRWMCCSLRCSAAGHGGPSCAAVHTQGLVPPSSLNRTRTTRRC